MVTTMARSSSRRLASMPSDGSMMVRGSSRRLVSMPSERSFSINQITITEEEDDFGVVEENRDRRGNNRGKIQEDEHVRQASRRVRWASTALVVYLILAGLGCAVGTAWSIRRREAEHYEDAFYASANALTAALPRDLQNMLVSLQVMAQELKTHDNLNWPYAKLPSFPSQAATLNQLAGAKQWTLLPVVRDPVKWEQWLLDKETDTSKTSSVNSPEAISSEAIQLPAWQTFPVDATTRAGEDISDWLSIPSLASTLRYVLKFKKQALSPVYQDSIDLESNPSQWQSTVFYPVVAVETADVNSTVVAILAATFTWRYKVVNNTPQSGTDLMETVVYSSCVDDNANVNQALFLTSQGKAHSADSTPSADLQMTISLKDIFGDDNPCQTTVLMLSVDEEKRDYHSIAPLWSAIACVGVFLMALTLYALVYYRVSDRHRLVLKQNAKSSAFVSTLFPQSFRDRVMSNMMDSRGMLSHVSEETGESAMLKEANFEDGEKTECRPEIAKPDKSSDFSPPAKNASTREPPTIRLKSFLRESTNPSKSTLDAKPIADFFPNCTVLFADICGFTAWSSQREPIQVFTLLQNLYAVFDRSARKMGVFKVETIGDSYVAVTGLPDPQQNHAVIMARFAIECKSKMRDVTKKLVKTLGPETEDLRMRFGLHSGPVTAGVLLGERSRFQLFGDTVNTAARMESCGQANRIQISEATADLLKAAGKGHMVTPRDELIEAKGKGTMRVYWLDENRSQSVHRFTRVNSLASTMSNSVISFGMYSSQENLAQSQSNFNLMQSTTSIMSTDDMGNDRSYAPVGTAVQHTMEKRPSLMWGSNSEVLSVKAKKLRRNSSSSTDRLIDWNFTLLLRLLKQVVTKRQNTVSEDGQPNLPKEKDLELQKLVKHDHNMVGEVAEIIPMPNFEPVSSSSVETQAMLSFEVENQLRSYVSAIATMYRDNPFHSYEHACHVQMSMSKLLERVLSPENIDYDSAEMASDAHNYTFGLTSDPLTQFTVVFCALIHDVDHTGVSNGQLIKEEAHIASLYKNQSVAEQNSIDLAWDLLMQDDYKDLRGCIYTNESEFKRFRQLVVNTVLATDIFDKELGAIRKNRWNKAFNESSEEESSTDAANRKATIVIEHLIQASDVSHCMQHWDIYRRWNERLFFEMYLAFKSGRTETDPSIGWYKGECWFFDNYVIPLAKKLDECGVFGVCSDECLVYALENRKLWELHGEKIVEEMLSTDYYKKLKEKEDTRQPRRGVRAKKKPRGPDSRALSSMDANEANAATPNSEEEL